MKSYRELIMLPDYESRVSYLLTHSTIGVSTLGGQRYLAQEFYTSNVWAPIRDRIIVRDNGCDLGLPGYIIEGPVHIHHIIPITREDIINMSHLVTDEDNLICVSEATHKLIHYGNVITDPYKLTVRTPYDTCPWKSKKG